jgi:KUP system potassium uptake protein
LTAFVRDLTAHAVARVPGIAVYLNSSPRNTPLALLHNVKLNRTIHEHNFVLTVLTEEVPHVPPEQRLEVHTLGGGFSRLIARYGFLEDPDVPALLTDSKLNGMRVDPAQVTYILSNNSVVASRERAMAYWRKRLFIFLSRNALQPSRFFRLPVNRVIELGMQISV